MISRNGEFKKNIAQTLRMLICCLLTVGLVGLVSSVGFAASYTWDAGGAVGIWNDEDNWGGTNYPDGTDDTALIPITATITTGPGTTIGTIDIDCTADSAIVLPAISCNVLTMNTTGSFSNSLTMTGNLTVNTSVTIDADAAAADTITLALAGFDLLGDPAVTVQSTGADAGANALITSSAGAVFDIGALNITGLQGSATVDIGAASTSGAVTILSNGTGAATLDLNDYSLTVTGALSVTAGSAVLTSGDASITSTSSTGGADLSVSSTVTVATVDVAAAIDTGSAFINCDSLVATTSLTIQTSVDVTPDPDTGTAYVTLSGALTAGTVAITAYATNATLDIGAASTSTTVTIWARGATGAATGTCGTAELELNDNSLAITGNLVVRVGNGGAGTITDGAAQIINSTPTGSGNLNVSGTITIDTADEAGIVDSGNASITCDNIGTATAPTSITIGTSADAGTDGDTGTASLTLTGALNAGAVTLQAGRDDAADVTLTLGSGDVQITGALNVTTLDLAAYVGDTSVSYSATPAAAFQVDGNVSVNSQSAGDVTLDLTGTTGTIVLGDDGTADTLTVRCDDTGVAGAVVLDLNDNNATINATLTITDGTGGGSVTVLSSGNLDISGGITTSGTAIVFAPTGIITLNGTAAQAINDAATTDISFAGANMAITNTDAAITFTSCDVSDLVSLTIGDGATVTANAAATINPLVVTLSGDATINGTNGFVFPAAALTIAASKTLIYSGTSTCLFNGTVALNGTIDLTGNGTLSFAGAVTIGANGTLSVDSTATTGAISTAVDITNSAGGTIDMDAGTITNTAAVTYTLGSGTSDFYAVTLNGGNLTISSAVSTTMNVDGAMTVSGATNDVIATDTDVSVVFSAGIDNSTGDDPFDFYGNVTFDAGSAVTINTGANDIVTLGSVGKTVTITNSTPVTVAAVGGTLAIGGDLVIGSGSSLDEGSTATVTYAGDITNSGTFTSNSLTLSGGTDMTVSDTMSLGAITIGAGSSITLNAGAQVTVTGNFTNNSLATALTASSAATISFQGDLTISGNAITFGCPVFIGSSPDVITIQTDVTFNENVTIYSGDTLEIDGSGTLDGAVVVTVASGKSIILYDTTSRLITQGDTADDFRVTLQSGTAGSTFSIVADGTSSSTNFDDASFEIQFGQVALLDVNFSTDVTGNSAANIVQFSALTPYCVDATGNANFVDAAGDPLNNFERVTPRADTINVNVKADGSYNVERHRYTTSWVASNDTSITYDIFIDNSGTLRASDFTARADQVVSSVTAASTTWNTTYSTPGDFYIYLVPTNDTDYAIVSAEVVRIARAYFTTGDDPLGSDDVATSTYTINWTDNDGSVGPQGTVKLYYALTSANSGTAYSSIDDIQNLSAVVPTTASGVTLPVNETDVDNAVIWDVTSVAAGTYYVYIVYEDGGSSYDVSDPIEVKATSVEILTPLVASEDGGNEWYTIQWQDADGNNSAVVRLYYSESAILASTTTMAGKALTTVNMTTFATNIATTSPDPVTEAVLINSSTLGEDTDGSSDRYLWNLSAIDPGNYYIYAMLDSDNDGTPESGFQSTGTVQVQHQESFVWFYNGDATVSWTNNTTAAVTASSTFAINSMSTNDMIYIGGYGTFTSITFDVTNTNSTASVMTVSYWNGTAWTDASATDGTAVGGVTLAQDAAVTWTAPSSWPENSVNSITRYWVRATVSVALDATTSIDRVTLNAIDSSVTVTSPANSIVATDSVVIGWIDEWNGATTGDVQLYYSATSGLTTSNIQASGTAIALDQAEGGTSGSSVSWDVSNVTAGTYYIYAVLDREGKAGHGDADVIDQAAGTVTVASSFVVTLANSTYEPQVGGTYTVTVNLNTNSLAVKSAAIYLDFDTDYLQLSTETTPFTKVVTWSATVFQNTGSNTNGTVNYVIGSATDWAGSSSATAFASVSFVVQQVGNLSVEISTSNARSTSIVDSNGVKRYPTVVNPVSGVGLGTISGQIDLEGRTNDAEEITFELRRAGSLGNTSTWSAGTLDEDATEEAIQVTTETDGSFYLTSVPTGYWYLTAKANNYLRRQNVDAVATGNTALLAITPGVNTTAYFQQLLGGECYDTGTNLEDNDIDADDLTVFATDFGGTETGSDINGSGGVDVDDFTMLAANYGETVGIAGPFSAYPGIANNNTAPSAEVSEAMLAFAGIPERPKVGKSFKVQVVLKNVENIRGYAFNLEYDPTQMLVVAKRGDFLAKHSSSGIPLFINKTTDTEDGKKIAFAEALMGSDIPGASGEGTVATLIIKPLEAGPLAITLIDGRLMPISGKSKEITEIMLPVIEVIKTPAASVLRQNYPNPFNPETWIPYSLKNDATVEIRIYNAAGQLVYTLHQGFREADHYVTRDKAAYWNGRNEYGERAASGIYFYQIRAGNFAATRKMVILK